MHGLDGFVLNDFQAFLSLASSLLAFDASRYLRITSHHAFLSCLLEKLPPKSNFRH